MPRRIPEGPNLATVLEFWPQECLVGAITASLSAYCHLLNVCVLAMILFPSALAGIKAVLLLLRGCTGGLSWAAGPALAGAFDLQIEGLCECHTHRVRQRAQGEYGLLRGRGVPSLGGSLANTPG